MSGIDTTDPASLVWQPRSGLKRWLHRYRGFHEALTQSVYRLQVPRAQVAVVLGFGDDIAMRSVGSDVAATAYQSFVVGIDARPLISEHSGTRSCIEISLSPWVAYRLFGGAAPECAAEVVALEDFWEQDIKWLTAQLSELPSWSQRFALIDQVLVNKLAHSHDSTRPEIRWAWHQLNVWRGCLPIRQLAQAIGWSDRYFAQRFRESIGITPKAAARQIRFTQAHHLITTEVEQPLSQIALACGYSDQSHLTREFQVFSGYSPAALQQEVFTQIPVVSGTVIQSQR